MNIDETLYSRQLYAIGKDAMNLLTNSSVIISGLTGSGIELTKCLILSGIKEIILHTPYDRLSFDDLSSNYFCQETDVSKPYLEKTAKKMSELNDNVNIRVVKHITVENIICNTVAIFCDYHVYDLLYWNRICRENNVKFIMLQTMGLTGNIFCDFGDNHIVNDSDGEPERHGLVSKIEHNRLVTIDAHKLYTGDVINITGTIEGYLTKNKNFFVKTITSTHFELHEYDDSICPDKMQIHAYNSPCIKLDNQVLNNLYYTQIKIKNILHFKSLEASLISPDYVMFDTIDCAMPQILNAFMQSISMQKLYDNDVVKSNNTVTRKYFDIMIRQNKINEQHANNIFQLLIETYNGRVCGVDAIIGSIGAQEVIKAISGKYIPNKQFLHFEALNILPAYYLKIKSLVPEDYLPDNTRYDGQIKIFGKKYLEIMQNKKMFIVGAGAIGCEHIKNFAMMGIKNIIITDMDRIEKSNLSRQFLFRNNDIGKSKSVIASKKGNEMNNNITIISHENKICTDTLNVYDTAFFRTIDIVANALDNIEARLFVDTLCVKYCLPLLEAGTLGTKGNVQVIVPHLTETYGSLQDPPEENIPVCTLKLFPYKYEHVVQYARDIFEGYFNKIPSLFIKIKNNNDILNTMTSTELYEIFEDVKLIGLNCNNFKHCINIAYKIWHRIFRDNIKQLVEKHPENSTDENGNLFWSGNRLFPWLYDFEIDQDTDIEFIKSFSNLWADMLGITKRYPYEATEKYQDFLNDLTIPEEYIINTNVESIDKMLLIKKIIFIVNKDELCNIKPIEFEKDDDTNHHIDFITATSHLRAGIYDIKTVDKLETKRIAGKIIPALATTTSLVSGLISLELYKLIFGQITKNNYPIDRYRYGSFNLAVQLFGFSEPIPVKKITITDKTYSVWDKIIINPETTIKDLIHIYTNSAYYIDFIGYNAEIVYSPDDEDEDDNPVYNMYFDEIIKKHRFIEKSGEYFFKIGLLSRNNSDNKHIMLDYIVKY